MKKNILLTIILFTNMIYSQFNAVVEYSYDYKQTEGNNKELGRMVSSLNSSIAQYAKEHKYVLKFNSNESFYNVVTGLKPESVDEKTFQMSTQMFRGGKFYQNKSKKYILNEKVTYSGKKYLIKDTLINDWKISNETKYIEKYKCYRASKKVYKNQELTVWFTPDIPLPFGPVGYGGLPGLILEINYLQNSLKLKSIKFYKNIKIIKPNQGEPVTVDEYKKIRLERRRKLYEKMLKHR